MIARSRLFSVTLFLLIIGLAAAPAWAAPRIDSAKEFTITRLTPDPGRDELTVVFSQPVDLKQVRRKLSLVPGVEIDWRKARAEGKSVILPGRFQYARTYVVNVRSKWVVGGRTYRPTESRFYMPDAPPRAEYASPGSVIELHSRQLVHVRVVNSDRIGLSGLTVPPALLPLALAAAEAEKEASWDQVRGELKAAASELALLAADDDRLAPFLTAPRALKQSYVTTALKNETKAFSLPLTFRPQSDRGGLILARFTWPQGGQTGHGPARLIRITDLGLSYKAWPGGLLVWSTSLQRAEGRYGLQVLGLTKKLELFPLGQTTGQGLLEFKGGRLTGYDLAQKGAFSKVERRVEPGEIAYLVVGDKTDASFIQVRGPAGVKPAGVVRVGDKGADPRPIKAEVFTDRGVYRPGETVHFKAVVRRLSQGRSLASAGLKGKFSLITSRGEKIYDRAAELSEFGTAAASVKLAAHLPLGRYRVEYRWGKGRNQAAADGFMVQEFVRPRHYAEVSFKRLTASADQTASGGGTGQLVRVTVQGLYYAGGAVKSGQVRWRIGYAGVAQSVEGFDGYHFGSPDPGREDVLEQGEAVLDEQGRLSFDFPLDGDVLAGQKGLKISATVLDFDGRSATANREFSVRPELLVGISDHPNKVQAGTGQSLHAIVTDRFGKRVYFGQVEVEVLQESGAYIRKRNQRGDLYWNYETIWRRAFGGRVPIKNGQADFKFDFAWGGNYRVAFTYRDNGRAYSSTTSFAATGDVLWQAYYDRNRAFDRLTLTADQERYRPGQTARIYVQPDRPLAQCLVTVEQGGVVRSWVTKFSDDKRYIDLPLTAEYAPNIYVSVLALTPRGKFPLYPTRYDAQAPGFVFGTISLPVEISGGKLEVALGRGSGQLKGTPGQAMELELSVKDDQGQGRRAELAVGVIDESVLALTGFKPPRLEDLLYFSLPLGVFTGEERRLLQHQTPFSLAKNMDLTGGGEAAMAMMGAQTAKVRGDFRPVAYFNPQVVTDDGGRAKIRFTLPDTMTTYRVYAVVCDTGGGFATVSRSLLASREFFIEPGLPRFLNRGDKAQIKVRAFNRTAQTGPALVTVETQGGLSFDRDRARFNLPADSQGQTVFLGLAEAAGPAKTLFRGGFGDQGDAVSLPLPILTGQVSLTDYFAGRVTGQTEIKLDLPEWAQKLNLSQVGPGEAQAVLTVTGSPLLRLVPALKRLAGYPYGCVEQTASRVIGLAALRPQIGRGLIPGLSAAKADKRLGQGLDRLLSLQLDSGGFAYWPGRWQAHAWGSTYAGLALVLARQAGLKVDDRAFNSALTFLARNVEGGWQDRTQRAASCYVLALAGKPVKKLIGKVGQDWERLTPEAKILLFLAAIKAGLTIDDKAKATAEKLIDQGGPGGRNDDFRAVYRQPATALLLAQAMFPGQKIVDRAMDRLLGGLGRSGYWTSTSDTGWSLYALAGALTGADLDRRPVTVTVSQAGLEPVKAELDPTSFRTFNLEVGPLLEQGGLTIASSGQGRLNYSLELTLPRPEIGRQGLAEGLKLTRRIENLDGGDKIRVGDLVKVTLRLDAGNDRTRYLVLDDALPAGLTPLNSALAGEEPPPVSQNDRAYRQFLWHPDGYYDLIPDHLELRDQRVLAFCDYLWSGRFRFSYIARATVAGEFLTPPAKAALMYSPQVRGFSPAGRLVILPAEE